MSDTLQNQKVESVQQVVAVEAPRAYETTFEHRLLEVGRAAGTVLVGALTSVLGHHSHYAEASVEHATAERRGPRSQSRGAYPAMSDNWFPRSLRSTDER